MSALSATILERKVEDGIIKVRATILVDGVAIGEAEGAGATLAQCKADLKSAALAMNQVTVGMSIDLGVTP